MRTRTYVEARRAFNRALHAHRAEIRAELDFGFAIDEDFGERVYAPDPDFTVVCTPTERRLFLAVANAYGVNPYLLDTAILDIYWNEVQTELRSVLH